MTMIGISTSSAAQHDRDDEARAEALERLQELELELAGAVAADAFGKMVEIEREIDRIKTDWFAAHHYDLEDER